MRKATRPHVSVRWGRQKAAASDFNRLFGDRVRTFRLRAGLTQEDVAEALDLARTTVVNVEAGRQCLRLEKMCPLAALLGVSLEMLLHCQGKKPVFRVYPTVTTAHCHAGRDGDCIWDKCPQTQDGEPQTTGRNCPFWDHRLELEQET
jgi:transcriptional regulator with XRE-family HTH domain